MRIKPIFSLLILIAVLVLSGCQDFFPSHTASSTQYYSSEGVNCLAVTNITGNVTILQGSGDTITVQAVKTSWSRDDLEYVQIIVTEGATISVVTDYSYDRSSSVSVDYVITLPADIAVTVLNVTGDVSVDGITSVGKLSVTTGDISVRHCGTVTELLTTTGTIITEIRAVGTDVTIRTTTGNITAWVDPDVNAGLYPSIVTGRYIEPAVTPSGEFEISLSVITGNITVYNM